MFTDLHVSDLDVPGAAHRLAPYLQRTAMLRPTLDPVGDGGHFWVKAEGTQFTGSYHARGAYNALERLPAGVRQRGVICHSPTGNFGRAVAWAARQFRVKATVVLAAHAPVATKKAIIDDGADLITYNAHRDGRAFARSIRRECGLTWLDPASREAMEGAGTVAWEMLQTRPEEPKLAAIMVPVRSGALAAATAATAAPFQVPVIGVEAVPDPSSASVTAAIHVPGDWHPFLSRERARFLLRLNRQYLSRIVQVNDADIADAMEHLHTCYRLVAEPTGALALAGALAHRAHLPPGPIGIICSGANTPYPPAPDLAPSARAGHTLQPA